MSAQQLDLTRSFAEVYGSDRGVKFSQDGHDFNAAGVYVPSPVDSAASAVRDDKVIETDELASAKAFLQQILKSRPLSKATIYRAAEENNQRWPVVKRAANQLKILSFKYQDTEHWKVPQEI